MVRSRSTSLPLLLVVSLLLGCGRADFQVLPTATTGGSSGSWPSTATLDGKAWTLFGEVKEDPTEPTLRAVHWDGSAWVGEPLPGHAYGGELSVSPTGTLVASWISPDGPFGGGGPRRFQAATWTGAGWESLVDADLNDSAEATLRLDASSHAVVALDTHDTVTVSIDGTQLGTELLSTLPNADQGDGASKVALELDSTGMPVVALARGSFSDAQVWVLRWSSEAWETLGDGPLPLSEAFLQLEGVALRLDASGAPVVSIAINQEGFGSSGGGVKVIRWSGDAWETLGTPLQGEVAKTPPTASALRIDSAGNPVVAFAQGDWGDAPIHLFRWEGNAWVRLGAPLNAGSKDIIQAVSLALEDDTPVVTWMQELHSPVPFVPDPTRIYAARYTGP